ncbi:MAG: hypothetical protein GXY86_16885 [Firmicutes bacterium]|nr:hypothetical protein [Bacillota bacterium]
MGQTIKWIFLLAILLIIFPMQSDAILSPRETIMQLLKEYSPSGYHLVTRVEGLPDNKELYLGSRKIVLPILKEELTTWVHGDTEKDILTAIGTVVHEMCHYYTGNMAYPLLAEQRVKVPLEEYYDAYYIEDGNDILVKRTKVFNTREIAAIIPESLRTFRFSYVNAEKTLASQILGIYGLMDEFCAYYYGTKAAVEIYPYYRDKMTSGVDRWITYLDQVNAVYFAYPEFKFFILKYLQYAKSHYPSQYREIIENKGLIRTFFIIDQNYAALIARYNTIKEEIFEDLQNEGYTVTEKNNHYQIARAKPFYSHSGNNYFHYFEILLKELQKQEYRLILDELKTD